MNRFKLSLLALVLVTTSVLAAETDTTLAPQQSVMLKMNLKKGVKYLYTTNTKQNITQKLMGNEMKIDQNTRIAYVYEVTKSDADGMQIKTTYQDIAIHTQTPQGNMDYDSKSSENQEGPLKTIEKLVGKSFTMQVSPEGKVTEASGMNEIMDAFSGSDPSNQLLKQQFSDSAIINMMDIALNIYPNRTTKVGESWQKQMTTEMANMMLMDMQNNYTLSALNNDQATISLNSTVKMSPLPSGGILGNIKIDLQGSQKGTIQAHTKTGLITSSTLHQDISGTISAQGMEIPMHIISDITLTGKEL